MLQQRGDFHFTSRLNQGREDIHKFNETRRPLSGEWKLWEILTNLYIYKEGFCGG